MSFQFYEHAFALLHFAFNSEIIFGGGYLQIWQPNPWARILKHLLEAEKSTFRKELSFQRLESTTGHVQAPEPEFLNILKCNSAESVSAGFQLNFLDILNNTIKMYTGSHFVQFSILLKFTQTNNFYQHTKL